MRPRSAGNNLCGRASVTDRPGARRESSVNVVEITADFQLAGASERQIRAARLGKFIGYSDAARADVQVDGMSIGPVAQQEDSADGQDLRTDIDRVSGVIGPSAGDIPGIADQTQRTARIDGKSDLLNASEGQRPDDDRGADSGLVAKGNLGQFPAIRNQCIASIRQCRSAGRALSSFLQLQSITGHLLGVPHIESIAHNRRFRVPG